jgi:hypothetical protein
MQAWSVARPGLTAEKSFSLYAIAGAITLLLFAGIAWDLTLWIASSDVTNRASRRVKTADCWGAMRE